MHVRAVYVRTRVCACECARCTLCVHRMRCKHIACAVNSESYAEHSSQKVEHSMKHTDHAHSTHYLAQDKVDIPSTTTAYDTLYATHHMLHATCYTSRATCAPLSKSASLFPGGRSPAPLASPASSRKRRRPRLAHPLGTAYTQSTPSQQRMPHRTQTQTPLLPLCHLRPAVGHWPAR